MKPGTTIIGDGVGYVVAAFRRTGAGLARKTRLVFVSAVFVSSFPSFLAPGPVLSQSAPLPEADAFLAATRENLERSRREARSFAYTERRTELHTNPFGRIGSGKTRAFEVTPSAGGTFVERRLVEDDGQPVVGAEVERTEVRRGLPRPGRRSTFDDTAAALRFTLDRREIVKGRPAIVVRFEPRSGVQPETREGRMAQAFQGSIWVDEQAREVMQVQAMAIDSLSYGMGVVARLNKGSVVELARAEVASGAWQVTSIRFMGEGRALLFRKLRVDHVLEWFNYRRVLEAASID